MERIPLGEFDARVLVDQWDKLRALASRMEQVDDASADPGLTARKFDESQTAGHRVYIFATAQISNGMEHVESLRDMFLSGGVTPRTPWTLLRSVFESGFWATWVLEPEAGMERRKRGLRAEVRGMVERSNFYDSLLKYDPQKRQEVASGHMDTEQVFRDEVQALGMEWAFAKNRINLIAELERLEAVREMEPFVQAATHAMWRSLSAMQHGHAYALVLNSDVHDRLPIQGGERRTVTIKENAFLAAAASAHALMATAMNLYVRRATRP